MKKIYKKSKNKIQQEAVRMENIVKLKNKNLSTAQISQELGLSVPTVREELKKINSVFDIGLQENGFGDTPWNHGWLKIDGASIHIKNSTEQIDFDKLKENLLNDIKKYSPNFKTIKREKSDPVLQVIDIADHHFGKLSVASETGEDYNLEIAKKRFEVGVDESIKNGLHKKVDKFLFVIGNDALHIDSPYRKTTAGTPQDTSGQWHQAFDTALKAHIDAIEKMLPMADIHIVFCPSNHDYMSGYMLAQAIQCYFNKSKNITWDISIQHRKYFTYGDNLILTTHGDGAKEKDLNTIILKEADAFNKNVIVLQHHIHHKISHDIGSTTVEYMRSACGTDGWHDRNGYLSKRATDTLLIDKKQGLIGRLTHFH